MRNPEIVGEYIGFAPFGANVPSIGLNQSGTAANAHTAEALPLTSGNYNWNACALVPNPTCSVFPVWCDAQCYDMPGWGLTANYSGSYLPGAERHGQYRQCCCFAAVQHSSS